MSEEAVGYVGLGAVVGLIGLRLLLGGRRDRPDGAGDRAPPFGDDAGTLPLNTVRMQRADFLRVRTRYDVGLHLSAQTESYGGPARPAGEPKRRRDSVEFPGYDSDELRRPGWTPRTMCGLPWRQMASHAVEIALLSTGTGYMCRSCTEAVERGEGIVQQPSSSG